ncbi:hypothetical protein [Microbacterium lacticum]
MHDDAELPCCPVVGVLLPVPDVIERPAELDGDALGIDADIEITRSVPTCPRPQVSAELLMQVTEERVREDIGEQVDLLRLIAEDLTSLWGEGVCFFRVQRRLAVSGPTPIKCAACARRGSARPAQNE